MTFNTASDALTGTPNTSVPGVVLAVAPNGSQVLINDQVRRVLYIYNGSGSVAANFTGMATSAAWTPDSKTLYIADSVSAGAGHSDTLYVYNANTGFTSYDLTASGGATNVAVTVPSVGAYLSGNPTVAHTWCPSGTASNYSNLVFYPQGDLVADKTDTLAATADGQHMLGAAIAGGGVEITDIAVSIPFTPSNGVATGGTANFINLPKACPQSGQTLEPLYNWPSLSDHPAGGWRNQCDGSQSILTSRASNLAFLTYTGSTPGAKLPYYTTTSNGAPGTVNYVTFTGGTAVTAPLTGPSASTTRSFSFQRPAIILSTSSIQPPFKIRSRSIPSCPLVRQGLTLIASLPRLRPAPYLQPRLLLSRARPPSFLRNDYSRPAYAGLFPASNSEFTVRRGDKNEPLQHDRIKA